MPELCPTGYNWSSNKLFPLRENWRLKNGKIYKKLDCVDTLNAKLRNTVGRLLFSNLAIIVSFLHASHEPFKLNASSMRFSSAQGIVRPPHLDDQRQTPLQPDLALLEMVFQE